MLVARFVVIQHKQVSLDYGHVLLVRHFVVIQNRILYRGVFVEDTSKKIGDASKHAMMRSKHCRHQNGYEDDTTSGGGRRRHYD